MTDGWLCDRCETFRENKSEKSTFTTTVEATGRRREGTKGEESTWDLCPNCATHLLNALETEPDDEDHAIKGGPS